MLRTGVVLFNYLNDFCNLGLKIDESSLAQKSSFKALGLPFIPNLESGALLKLSLRILELWFVWKRSFFLHFFFCISKCLFCCIFHGILGFHRMLGFLTFIWICWNEYAGHLVQQLLLLFNSWLNVWMEPLLTYFISVPLNTLMTEVPLK